MGGPRWIGHDRYEMILLMDDDVTGALATLQELLPPRTTEYRSGAVLTLGFAGNESEEPVTEPIIRPTPAAAPESS